MSIKYILSQIKHLPIDLFENNWSLLFTYLLEDYNSKFVSIKPLIRHEKLRLFELENEILVTINLLTKEQEKFMKDEILYKNLNKFIEGSEIKVCLMNKSRKNSSESNNSGRKIQVLRVNECVHESFSQGKDLEENPNHCFTIEKFKI